MNMCRSIIVLGILFFGLYATAQSDALLKDTTIGSSEIVVNAFYARAKWKQMPAAIALIRPNELRNTPTPTFLTVFNAVPGVRMEERSPGSYRLSVRGSLLRSPFGIRNIKVYFNDLPLTDGGGNTYLNLIDISQISSAEILKGPVASAYGAGTGGAVLLQSDLGFHNKRANNYYGGLSGGSYGLFQQHAGWEIQDSNWSSRLQQVHLQSDGYRQQSSMRRDGLQWRFAIKRKQHLWRYLLFYTNLYYQTPGGINEAQFKLNPQLARQPAGALPGAVQQRTAIYNKTFYSGVHHQYKVNSKNSIRSFAMMSVTNFKNPFITNYEQRAEDNIGVGTQWQYRSESDNHTLQLNAGGEWQYQHSAIDNFGNRSGIKDTVQYRDKVYAIQWFIFSQLQYSYRDRLFVNAGLSINQQSYRYRRLTDPSEAYVRKRIADVVTPRIALSYAINRQVNIYTLIAKGFSAPSLAEFRPSDGNFYGDLNAESGWNIETGIKGAIFQERIQFDIAFYRFALGNAIVRRNSNSGAEYFINAGGTLQQGLEAMVKVKLIDNPQKKIRALSIWSSYSYQPYRFTEYRQGNTDFTNNQLTGVPGNTWVSGVDMQTRMGIYLHTSLNMVSAIPLNDANDAYADSYQLLQARIGYRKNKFDFFFSVDNGLNQIYSLGNDINALGRRYYNTAAARNFMFGMKFGLR
jgi:iron complex outermembrane recepter protein